MSGPNDPSNSVGALPTAPACVNSAPEFAPESFARPELLAPAGDWECVRAAVENGADAIYFGLDKFNARMRAQNFTAADLPPVMEFLHRRGVKGYVTFNILVFANEMAEAEQFLRAIITAGVDGVLVQDVGVCRLIRQLSPDFPIHASTQMTVTSAAGVDFAAELGCTRVVLARECPVREIAKIHAAQHGSGQKALPGAVPQPRAGSSVELETFIHGALCVAYSGQCLTSEALGGRSANRGECAQACRMPYDLIADGKLVPLGDRRYLLSPLDLAGLEVLPDLIRAGVAAIKIEGRLKSPEYVANMTRIYRRAIDEVHGRLSAETGATPPAAPGRAAAQDGASADQQARALFAESKYDMEMAFSRGLYTGWLRGLNNRELVEGRFGKKRGVFLGKVTRLQGERVAMSLEGPLKPGDGVVFDGGHPEDPEEGGRVYGVERRGSDTWISFGHGDLDFQRIHVGDRLWKTSDPELERHWRKSFAGEQPQFQRPLEFEVHGAVGQPMTVLVRDEMGRVVKVESVQPLAAAEKQPLDTTRLRDQLGRLGGTIFCLGGLQNHLEGKVILPVSELNRLRREAVTQLEQLRAQPLKWQLGARESSDTLTRSAPVNASPLSPTLSSCFAGGEGGDTSRTAAHGKQATVSEAIGPTQGGKPYPASQQPELIVLVRTWAQFEMALQCQVETLYCEFEDPKKYREAVAVVQARRAAAPGRALTLFVAPPRIAKMGEEWVLQQVRSCEADGYLVRNYDHLSCFAGCRCRGDFSLNVANALAAEHFMGRYGLERVTASYDLNVEQLQALLASATPEWFEITIHQHMPMFHTEYCVFCAFLSKGTDYTNCGRPCDRHQVALRDRTGAEHPVKADAGCRNTVFNSLAQTGAESVERLMALGARRFRAEFLNETPEEMSRTIERYRQLLKGEISGVHLWRDLRLRSQLGVTRGQMEKKE